MEFIQQFISEELIYALGWTVMHSLWQAFAIAIILALVLHFLQRKSAIARYEASVFALFLVLVSSVSTFIWYTDNAEVALTTTATLSTSATLVSAATEVNNLQGFLQSCVHYFNAHLPVIVLIWLVGVAFFILRLVGGLAYVQRLKHFRTSVLPVYWIQRFKAIQQKIPVKRKVRIMESAAVKVPLVIGYFKPFILLPLGAINQLSEQEVEAILAHELAHVFRDDFLMNIFISFVEVFFYYNPAVWWISGNIRLERENCCDDIAISVCGNSLIYAKALVRLQELNAYTPSFAMPFSGQKNQLLNRIRRILNQPQNRSNIMEKLTATIFLLFAIIFMSVSAQPVQSNLSELEVESIVSGHVSRTEGRPAPANKKEIHIREEVEIEDQWVLTIDSLEEIDARTIELTMDEEEIIEFVIDGRVLSDEKVHLLKSFTTDKMIVHQSNEKQPLIAPKGFGIQLAVDTFPKHILKLKGNAFASVFPEKGQTITQTKNKNGQTVIVIGSEDGEAIEILVDGVSDAVIINGNKLAPGDTTMVVRELAAFPDKSIWRLDDDKNELFFQHNNDSLINRFAFPNESMGKQKIRRLYSNSDSINVIQRKEIKELLARSKALQDEDALQMEEQYLELLALNKKMNADHLKLEQNQYLRDLDRMKEVNEARHLFAQDPTTWAKMNSADPLVKTSQKISEALKQDGLIVDTDNLKFSLSQKRLLVNGKKQSDVMRDKYLQLYEELIGNPLDRKSKYEISFSKN